MSIQTVMVPDGYRSIPPGFKLDLLDFTTITGENNSGKTNFIEAIYKKKAIFTDAAGAEIDVVPVYIPAESIVGDEELKLGKTAAAMTAINEIITTDPPFKLEDCDSVKNCIDPFVSAVNEKLKSFASSQSGSSFKINIEDSINLKKIISEVLSFTPSDSITNKEHKKFEELGQGWQRLIIIAFLLAQHERNSPAQPTLLMVEEPEAYLHPRLKRSLFKLLKELSNQRDYQVIITTHDPYLAAIGSDQGDGKSVVYTFNKRADGMTDEPKKGVILGIEDELLHILLIEKVMKKHSLANVDQLDAFFKAIPGMPIRDYNDRSGSIPYSLPVFIRNVIHHPTNSNTFSDPDLINSIEILNKQLV